MVQAPFICSQFSKSEAKAWQIKYLEDRRERWAGVRAQKIMERSMKASERGAHRLKPLSLVSEQVAFSPNIWLSKTNEKTKELRPCSQRKDFCFHVKRVWQPSAGVASIIPPWDTGAGVAHA